jgi:3-methyladenine DNA glycosylase AlkD
MTELVQTLRSLGKESTAKIYRRHGATGEVLGVSYADLGKLAKKHDGDHALAQLLWKSGVHEAQVLATQIADPVKATTKELEAWLQDVEGYPLTDALADFVSRTPHAPALMTKWMKSKEEWTASAGWRLLTAAALRADDAPQAFFEPYLKIIEKQLQKAQNRVRHSMNTALIAIGCRGAQLEALALKAAKAIGKVEVDHGETDCETPDAAAYIARTKARLAKKGRRK